MKLRWNRMGGQLGLLFCLAGLVFIWVGWNGAASYNDLRQQFPWLISGGLTGLALVIIGVGLFVVQSQRADRVQLEANLVELRRILDRMTGASMGNGSEPQGVTLVVAGPNAYHRPSCRLVQGREGLETITETIAQGISVNVTLIFSLERHGAVIDAYMAGLEKAKANGHDLSKIFSVASFFVSRMDTEVDARLDKLGTPEAAALRGKAAIANARLAYELFENKCAEQRWQALAASGANVQRPLWASTSTKDPTFPDTMYVVDLVVSDTVNTMPEATIKATADHGELRGDTVHGTYDQSRQVIADLETLGISYDDVVQVLEDEGVAKFAASWNELLETIRTSMEH